MGDILVCRETWTPKIRMAYKLTTCTFQFVVPVVLVVSVNRFRKPVNPRVARFFFVQYTTARKNAPSDYKITKCPLNMHNGRM
jgi:hypothetical protein